MKAVVKFGQENDMVALRDEPIPSPSDQEILLDVKAAGICGSDIEMWRHRFTYRVNTPVIQGHEFCGVIAETGRAVVGWKVGDRVVSETSAFVCGACRYCLSGDYNMCPSRLGFGYGTNGAFARYVAVRQQILHRIPEALSFEEAAIIEPACVAYNALVVRSRIRPGDSVVVIGPGPIGLNCLQMASVAGAGRLFLVGTEADEARLGVAKELCPNAVALCGNPEDTISRVLEATGGYGANLVVDAAGNSETLRLSLALVCRLGQITKIGWGPDPVAFSLDLLLTKAVTLQGTYGHSRQAWEHVIGLLDAGVLRLKPLVSHVLPISEWRRGYEMVESREAVKVILTPEGSA
ncbi:MAG: zinc-binding dehydrogenase [Candidatus Latescibacterota bacterium]